MLVTLETRIQYKLSCRFSKDAKKPASTAPLPCVSGCRLPHLLLPLLVPLAVVRSEPLLALLCRPPLVGVPARQQGLHSIHNLPRGTHSRSSWTKGRVDFWKLNCTETTEDIL
jgi:hypothetical protein